MNILQIKDRTFRHICIIILLAVDCVHCLMLNMCVTTFPYINLRKALLPNLISSAS